MIEFQTINVSERCREIYEKQLLSLKKEEVYIRYFKDPFCKDYVRITIGTEEENKILLSKIKKAIASK